MPAKTPIRRFLVAAAPRNAPNAADSIMPSMAILATPLRSQSRPARAPSVSGVAKRSIVASMLAATMDAETSGDRNTSAPPMSKPMHPMMKANRPRVTGHSPNLPPVRRSRSRPQRLRVAPDQSGRST